ncbi:MAG: hypothetical protein ACRDLP_16365 [Solirubrobacteraceae bacterium]
MSDTHAALVEPRSTRIALRAALITPILVAIIAVASSPGHGLTLPDPLTGGLIIWGPSTVTLLVSVGSRQRPAALIEQVSLCMLTTIAVVMVALFVTFAITS